MRSTIIGLVIAPIIIYFAISDSIPNLYILFNVVGVLIVAGGTISASIMTHGLKDILTLAKISLKVFTMPKADEEKVISDIIRMSIYLEKNPGQYNNLTNQEIHPFLRDGLRLIDNGFLEVEINEIMNNDVDKRFDRHMSEVELLKTIAKYPPAFGMIGTVIGLIGLLNTINSENQGMTNMIGPTMAVALLTTLYGLILSNYFFVPLSDNLFHRLYQDTNLRKMIIEGISLIQKKADPIYVREYLVVNLNPAKRKDIVVGAA